MMKKALKIILVIAISIAVLFFAALVSFFIITADAKLQPEKLTGCGNIISVYDENGEIIENASYVTRKKSVSLSALKDYTINAFIASEDRNFFRHNGLNYRRILKAAYKNMSSFSFKEGASTISQQLIKNTHLSNEKKISRKLKEMRLTRRLEKRYSKEEILEMYLNTIYFGHSCYGLQSAANFYFNKSAEELTLEESAAIAGIIASPNNYSPYKNPDKCISRRNLVLKSMLDCNFISESDYNMAIKSVLNISDRDENNDYSYYLRAVFDEFDGLGIDPYEYGELSIYTYADKNLQTLIDNIENETDSAIFLRNSKGGVVAYSSTLAPARRQIGSTAKPIFVYAPAIEEKLVHLFTKIKDEKIDFNGYSPENSDKKYHGDVSVLDSIKQSYNIPAVKILNTLNMDRIEDYAVKMGINLDSEDKNLSLALGGMKNGLTIKELCDCYSVFQNGGNFIGSSFIKEISDSNGKIIYKNGKAENMIFSEGTCSLINNALSEACKTGTAKKLKNVKVDVACKTGTCGNSEGNTDAYSICYTSEYVLGVWLGDRDNKKLNITGGGNCCSITKEILDSIYKDKTCPPLEKTKGTKTICIDREEYETDGKIILSDVNSPKINNLSVLCADFNLPCERSTRFTSPKIQKPSILVRNNQIIVLLCQTKYYSYVIKRYKNGNYDIIYDGDWKSEILDEPPGGSYTYSVTPKFSIGENDFYGDEIFLNQVMVKQNSDSEKLPDIVYKDWFNK